MGIAIPLLNLKAKGTYTFVSVVPINLLAPVDEKAQIDENITNKIFQ